MDLISAERNTSDDDTFLKKLQEEIQKIMDCTSVIHIPIPMELPHPLPPFKPDDTNLEKLEWIMPPIPVKLDDYVSDDTSEDIVHGTNKRG